MNTVTTRINELLGSVPASIKMIPENEMNQKPSPDKWSKKEILGHLCDSAINNILRVIRSQYEPLPLPIVSYHQTEWVELNSYQDMPAEDILNLWVMLNRQLVRAISSIKGDGLKNMCILNDGTEISIGKLMEEDYLKHMEHHLGQISGK